MILAVVLATLLLCFLLIRHHVGVPFLAMIAGISIYEVFGGQFANGLSMISSRISVELAQNVLYIVFVAFFPLLLYFRSGKSGLFGVMRFIESTIFALLLVALIAPYVAAICPFDVLAQELLGFIERVRNWLMLAGIIFAYVDALFYRAGRIF